MKITYDLEYLPERRAGQKSEEVLAIIAFLAGQQKNMCIAYDTNEDCKRRYGTLRGYKRNNKLQGVFDIWRKDNCIYVVKCKKAGKKPA